jgi:exodeoxyribonuclease VII small subunit
VAKERQAGRGDYGKVVERLQEIVESLEGGDLSLEDSLERFSEGIQLVKQGEKLLADAEKRIEQLVSEDGRAAPLKLSDAAEAAAPQARPAAPKRPAAPSADDEDVPF